MDNSHNSHSHNSSHDSIHRSLTSTRSDFTSIDMIDTGNDTSSKEPTNGMEQEEEGNTDVHTTFQTRPNARASIDRKKYTRDDPDSSQNISHDDSYDSTGNATDIDSNKSNIVISNSSDYSSNDESNSDTECDEEELPSVSSTSWTEAQVPAGPGSPQGPGPPRAHR